MNGSALFHRGIRTIALRDDNHSDDDDNDDADEAKRKR